MIVDSHAHAFPASVIARRQELLATEPAFAAIYSHPDAKMATAAHVLASMDAASVDRTIVCNFAWHDSALIDETNEYLLNESARSGGRLLPFVSVSLADAGRHGGPDADEAVGAAKQDARSMIRKMASYGARGIGELRPADSGYALGNSDEADLLAWAAAAFDLPLLVHATEPVGHVYPGKTGGPIDDIADFARSAPSVAVIAAHWGGGLPFYLLMPEVRDQLSNVYFDTAASHLLYDPAIYRRVIDLAGVDRILFGSDYPLTTQANALERTHAAAMTEDELRAVLGGNAATLFSL